MFSFNHSKVKMGSQQKNLTIEKTGPSAWTDARCASDFRDIRPHLPKNHSFRPVANLPHLACLLEFHLSLSIRPDGCHCLTSAGIPYAIPRFVARTGGCRTTPTRLAGSQPGAYDRQRLSRRPRNRRHATARIWIRESRKKRCCDGSGRAVSEESITALSECLS